HLISSRHISEALVTVGQWISPPLASRALMMLTGAIVGIALAYIGIAAIRRRGNDNGAALAGIMLVFALCYGILLATSISIVDFHTHLDERLLVPLLAAG